MKTYQEIATLIPVAGDNQDYVVITPDGRFDGTPAGMEKLIHFVVGTEIIELSQLKERFYTPDLWQTLLTAPEKLSTVENIKQIKLYPEVKLSGKGNTLTINLKPSNGGIGKVNVYINGREVNESKTALPDFNPQRKTQIQLNLKDYQSYFSEGKNLISVKAYHEEGWLASRFQYITYQKGTIQNRSTDTTSSARPGQEGLQEAGSVDLDFDPADFQGKAVGDFYALCIGTSDYQGDGSAGSIRDLTFPTSDAQAMALALQIGAKKFFVDEDEPNKNKIFIRTLSTDDKNPANQPTKENIRKAFQEIAAKAKAEDVFVVFFAGHGTTFKKESERFELFYYLTKDATSGNLVQDAIRESRAISSDELIAWLKEIKANKQVMILDACHAGQAVENIFAQRDVPSSQKRALELMKDRTGLYIISGSAANAVSYESSEYGQGFLTYSLLLGMSGAALEKETSLLNVGTWFKYAANEVNRMAAEYNSTQQPQVAEPQTNFWIGKFEEKDRNLIPLKEAKPMFGGPRFMNSEKLKDDLDLEQLVQTELLEGVYSSRSANYIFTDSKNKKIHQINGLYTIDAQGNIKITLKIYKGDTLIAEIKDLEGNTQEIQALAEDIVREAKKRVLM